MCRSGRREIIVDKPRHAVAQAVKLRDKGHQLLKGPVERLMERRVEGGTKVRTIEILRERQTLSSCSKVVTVNCTILYYLDTIFRPPIKLAVCPSVCLYLSSSSSFFFFPPPPPPPNLCLPSRLFSSLRFSSLWINRFLFCFFREAELILPGSPALLALPPISPLSHKVV